MINDGTNVLAPAAAENIGVEPGTIIQWNGYAGMIAVIGFIIVGQINKKIGARATSAIFTILAGIMYIVCGNATSLPVYVIAMVLLCDWHDVSRLYCRRYTWLQPGSRRERVLSWVTPPWDIISHLRFMSPF